MFKQFNKIKTLYQDMELNKTTKNVDEDIKHLQFKNTFKHLIFYSSTTLFSISLYYGALNQIKSDEFRSNLITQVGVAPINTFFYDSYTSYDEDIKQSLDLIDNKILDLKNQSKKFINFYYSYESFLLDIKNGKVKINNFDKKFNVKDYKEIYYRTIFSKNLNLKLKLGSKEYTILDISKKVYDEAEDIKQGLIILNKPTDILIEKLKLNSSDKNIIKRTLLTFSKILKQKGALNFYQKVKIKENGLNEMKETLYSGQKLFTIRLDRSSYDIELPNLQAEYKAEKYKKYKKYEAEKDKNLAKEKTLNKAINDLQESKNLIENLESDINFLHRNLAKYDEIKKVIDEDLEKLEDVEEWNQ